MIPNPLHEILETERSIAAAIKEAAEEATAALTQAQHRADQLVDEARARGQATAARRYQEGLTRAHDEGDRIRGGSDERVATLRRQAKGHLSAAVDLVMDTVVPSPKET